MLQYFKHQYTIAGIRYFIAIVFFLSAYFKLIDIEYFELSFVSAGITNFKLAPIAARLMISLEYLLGFFLISNIYRNTTIKSVVLLLIAFNLHLAIQIVLDGDKGNCGCFGTAISMTPGQSILKNVFLIIIAYWALIHQESVFALKKYIIIVAISFSIYSFVYPFIYSMPSSYYDTEAYLGSDTTHFPVEYLGDYHFSDNSNPDLKNGSYIIGVFSLKCPHCVNAAYKLQILDDQDKNNELLPMYVTFFGKKNYINSFIENARLKIPYHYHPNKDLIKLTGGKIPSVFVVKDGKLKKMIVGEIFTKEDLIVQ